jgi:hypothetical protein
MTDDDDYTLLDQVQDLGAWIFFCSVPAFVLSVIAYTLGWWRS